MTGLNVSGINAGPNTSLAFQSEAVMTTQAGGSLSLFSNGFVGDGVTDDAPAIQKTFNAVSAAGSGKVTFPPGAIIKINSGLTIQTGSISVDFNSAILDATGMSSGYALSFLQTAVPQTLPGIPSSYGLRTTSMPIGNLTLLGPNSNTNSTDGVFIGSGPGSGQVSGQLLANIQISGFRTGLYIGNNAYLNGFFNLSIAACWQYGLAYYGNTNTGENWGWVFGRISNCVNGGTAIGLYMEAAPDGRNELGCTGISFDYNDNSIVNYGGVLTLTNCHVEDSSANPMIAIMGQASSQGTGVYLFGGSIAPTNSSPTQRANLVTIDAGNNPKTFFKAKCRWNSYGNAATFVTVLNSLNTGNVPEVSLTDSIVDYNAPSAAYFPSMAPTAVNRLANPGFEALGSGSLQGWVQTLGSGQTWSLVTTPVHSGSYAAQVVATGTTNGSLAQETPVVPGQQYNLRVWVNVTAVTAGGIFITVHFYSYDNTFLVALNQYPEIVATTGGWIPIMLSGTVPNGASLASVQCYLYGFTGTAVIDDAEFYAL